MTAVLLALVLPPRLSVALDDALFAAGLPPDGLAFARAAEGPAQVVADPRGSFERVSAWHAAGPSSLSDPLKGLFGAEAATPAPRPTPDLSVLPEGLRAPVGRILVAMLEANAALKRASAGLSDEERKRLVTVLPALADPLREGRAEARALAARVDLKAILGAGAALQSEVDAALPELRRAAVGDVAATRLTVQGVTIEIGGLGSDDHFSNEASLIVDLGGDDRYGGRAAYGVGRASVVVDLGGDDVYRTKEGGPGGGLLGIGLLIDEAGDDDYRASEIGLGAGLLGVGILRDAAGNDRYDARSLSGGFGARGLGWLADGSGDDTYRIGEGGLAAGVEGGAGLLTDRAGNDRYVAGGRALAYGCAGGFGALMDGGGDDGYVADRLSVAMAEGAGAAWLLDAAGQDFYLVRRGVGIAAAARESSASLWDLSGSDVYAGATVHPAFAEGGSMALLLDGGGDDRYAGSPAVGLDGAAGGALALLVDAGGADAYDGDLADGEAMRQAASAALDDGTADVPAERPSPPPTEGVTPVLLLARAAHAPTEEERAAAREALSLLDFSALSEGADEEEARILAALTRRVGGAALLLTAADSADDARATGAWRVLSLGVFEEARGRLAAALDRPATRRSALRLAGSLQAREVLSRALPLMLDEDPLVAREAAIAVAAAGTASEASSLEGSLGSPDPLVRRAVEAFYARFPELGSPLAARLAASETPLLRRRGMVLTSRLGPEGVKLAVAALADADPGVRIEALRALDGRCPPDAEDRALALRRDPDVRVAAAARRFRP